MSQFSATFGAWFGALLAAFAFIVAVTLFVFWVLSHLAPDKK